MQPWNESVRPSGRAARKNWMRDHKVAVSYFSQKQIRGHASNHLETRSLLIFFPGPSIDRNVTMRTINLLISILLVSLSNLTMNPLVPYASRASYTTCYCYHENNKTNPPFTNRGRQLPQMSRCPPKFQLRKPGPPDRPNGELLEPKRAAE